MNFQFQVLLGTLLVFYRIMMSAVTALVFMFSVLGRAGRFKFLKERQWEPEESWLRTGFWFSDSSLWSELWQETTEELGNESKVRKFGGWGTMDSRQPGELGSKKIYPTATMAEVAWSAWWLDWIFVAVTNYTAKRSKLRDMDTCCGDTGEDKQEEYVPWPIFASTTATNWWIWLTFFQKYV